MRIATELCVDLVVHGRGRGHASRARSVASVLRTRGHAVRVFAGDAAFDALAPFEPDLVRIACFGPGPRLAARFVRRALDDHARLSAHAPDVLVSDGDAPSMHAAASLRIPVVSVGHGLVFAHCRVDVGRDLGGRLREAANALSSSWLADARVAVHFAAAEPRDARTSVARIEPRSGLDRDAKPTDLLVAYFRDTPDLRCLTGLARVGENVRLFGEAARAPRGVEVLPLDEARFSASLSVAKGVVGTSGSNLLAEAAHLGIPMLALHAPSDVEQRLNAAIAERLGLGLCATLGDVDDRTLARFRGLAARVASRGRGPSLLPSGDSVSIATARAVEQVGRSRSA